MPRPALYATWSATYPAGIRAPAAARDITPISASRRAASSSGTPGY